MSESLPRVRCVRQGQVVLAGPWALLVPALGDALLELLSRPAVLGKGYCRNEGRRLVAEDARVGTNVARMLSGGC